MNNLFNQVNTHLQAVVQRLRTTLATITSDGSGSSVLFENRIIEAQKLFLILDQANQSFAGVGTLDKWTRGVANEAIELLDQQQQQVQRKIATMLRMKVEDEMKQNKDKWDMIHNSMRILQGLASVNSKFTMKSIKVNREIMKQVVQRIILETTAKNNDLSLIRDNFDWIKEYHSDCSQLEQLYNDTLRKNLNKIQTQCQTCTMNLLKLDAMMDQVKEITNLVHQVHKYCVNSSIVDESVAKTLNDMIQSLSDRISSMIYSTLSIGDLAKTKQQRDRQAEEKEIENKDEKNGNLKRKEELYLNAIHECFENGKFRRANSLSITKMDNLLKFIDICNDIYDATNVMMIKKLKVELVYHFLQYYGEYRCKQISSAIDYLLNESCRLGCNAPATTMEEKDDVTHDAYVLQTPNTEADAVTNIQQIIEINSKYLKLKQFMFLDLDIDDLVHKWKNEMNTVLENLENTLKNDESRKSDEFPAIISLIVALKKSVDCGILDKDRFMKLYNETKGAIDDDYQKLIQNISSRNFSAIGKYMNAFDVKKILGKQYESLRGLLGEMLVAFGEEANGMLQNPPLTMSDYESFITQFEKIIDGFNDVEIHGLDKQISSDDARTWKRLAQRVLGAVKQWQRKLVNMIEKNAKTFMMRAAHSRIEILHQIWDKTDNTCLKIENQSHILAKVKQMIQQQLKNLEKSYSNWCIYNPKKWKMIKQKLPIYNEQIEQSMEFCQMHNNSTKYCSLYRKLCEKIWKTCKQSIDSVLSEINDVDENYYEHCVKLEFLDLLLNGAVVSQLKTKRNLEEATQFSQVYEMFWGKKKKEDELLIEEMQGLNFDDVEAFSAAFVELYLKYHARKQYDDQTVACKLLSIMIDKMQKHVDNIFNILETQSESMSTLKSALRLMKQIIDIEKMQYKPVLSMIKKKFNKIRRCIEKWANKQSDTIIEHFSNGLVHELPMVAPIETANDISERIWNLCELIVLKGTRSYEPFILDNFAIELSASFIENLHKHFTILNNKFDSAVQRLDYNEIELYFNYIEMYDSKTKCYHTIRRIYSEMSTKTLQSICKTKKKQFNDGIMLNLAKMSHTVLDRLSKEQTKIMGQSLIHEQRFSSMAARKSFYENVKYAMEELKGSVKLSKFLTVDPMEKLYGACVTKISKEVKKATKRIANAFKAHSMLEDSFKMINDLFSNLQALSKVDLTGDRVNHKKFTVNIDSIKRKIVNKLIAVGDECVAPDSNAVKVAKFFIKLQMASHHLLDKELKEVTTTTITKNLEQYQANHGILELAKILTRGKQLNEDEIIWGREIVNSQNIFSGAAIQLWNAKMNDDMKMIEEVLRRTHIHLHTKDFGYEFRKTLKKHYAIFEKTYIGLLNKHITKWNSELSPQENLAECVVDTKVIATNIQYDNDDITKAVSNNFGENVSKLIAHVFSLWTFLDSKYYFNCLQSQDENELKTDELDSDTESDEDTNVNTMVTDNDDNKTQSVNYHDADTATRTRDPRYYLKQPKITQVVAVMILMSLDNCNRMKLVSNLVQIGTGEGKSLVLAVLACIFALLGYNVYCVSYGKLLAQRDSDAFWSLFTLLDVGKDIDYGTYVDLCGELLGEVVNYSRFRQTITGMTVNGDQNDQDDHDDHEDTDDNNSNDAKRILLIDEVDVFFDARYFGKTIRFASGFQHRHISDWLDLVWEKINTKMTPFGCDYNPIHRLGARSMTDELKQTQQYENLAKVFGFYMPIIDAQIMYMLAGALQVLNGDDTYVIYNDKIGVKRDDHIDTKVYGHDLMFAYYYEHELGNISEESLTIAKKIFIECGRFSYAEIPRSFNNLIVGVTGTLITLTDYEKNILEDTYNINKYTYMPSIFKDSKLKFNHKNAVHLYSDDTFAFELEKNIETAREGTSMVRGHDPSEQYRPVLVFFKDDKTLKEFYNSDEFDKLRNETLILNEELTHPEKMKLIKDACRLNTITLATRIFGRGTDFQVIDERVNKIGGTHVIQTFFSTDISEEVQIKGRTARHGDPGSFSMVLNVDDVCKDFDIIYHDDKKAMESAKDVYGYLAEKREEKMKNANAVSLVNLEKAKEQHNQAYQLQHVLKENNREKILKVLLQMNNI